MIVMICDLNLVPNTLMWSFNPTCLRRCNWYLDRVDIGIRHLIIWPYVDRFTNPFVFFLVFMPKALEDGITVMFIKVP